MNKQKTQLQVTSLAQLQEFAQGEVVELPGFVDGESFVVRMRRPSLLALAKSGRIPNSLLATANQMFADTGKMMMESDENMLADLYEIMEIIINSCLLEPTHKDIQNAGLELTDEQTMAIFNYTQMGVKALEPFRTK